MQTDMDKLTDLFVAKMFYINNDHLVNKIKVIEKSIYFLGV